MKTFWQGLSAAARATLIVGVAVIVLVLAFSSWWFLRTDYQVLFADLKPQDTTAMVAELERLKVPYKLTENTDKGDVIWVDRASVHSTRIKLMGKDIPLHGAVGFELFNNNDFAMSEFTQKINYQRALQGELTRTILSLSEVRDVRVHLALPEQGLFKQASSSPKAAVTLTLRAGQTLRPEQVLGIQRLVAAAVPGMQVQDVTIVDHQGIALNRVAEAQDAGSSARLELQKEAEAHLTRKASAVLENAVGPGLAMVSVDVTLDMNQVRTTTENVLATPTAGKPEEGQLPTGVVVRERENVREPAAPLDAKSNAGDGARGGGSTQREVDYQVGKRLEQVVSQPGSIRRIQVVAVVHKALQPQQQEQLQKTLAAAVGAVPERGDTVVVHVQSGMDSEVHLRAETQLASASTPQAAAASGSVPLWAIGPWRDYFMLIGAVLLALVVGLVLFAVARRNAPTPAAAPMTEAQRQAALQQVQTWLRQEQHAPPFSAKDEGL